MGKRIDLERLQISTLSKSDEEYEALWPEEMYRYIKWMMIDFVIEDEEGIPVRCF